MDINPFSDIRIAGIFFLFTLLIVSFINSVLKTGSPGHIAGEVQERDLNLAIPEPGRLTRVLSFLAGASASLIFMIPHNQQNFVGPWWYLGCCDESLGPRAYSWYRECLHIYRGRCSVGGPTLATPQNVLRGESLPPRAAHADCWEDAARPPWEWLSHCAHWADLWI